MFLFGWKLNVAMSPDAPTLRPCHREPITSAASSTTRRPRPRASAYSASRSGSDPGHQVGRIEGEEVRAFGDGVGGNDEIEAGPRRDQGGIVLEAETALACQRREYLSDHGKLVHDRTIREKGGDLKATALRASHATPRRASCVW